jgi:hypothetical protein
MSMASSDPPIARVRLPGRQRGLASLALVLASEAVVGGGAWGLLSVRAAVALRPTLLDQPLRLDVVEVQTVTAPARQQMLLVTLASFAALVCEAQAPVDVA